VPFNIKRQMLTHL